MEENISQKEQDEAKKVLADIVRRPRLDKQVIVAISNWLAMNNIKQISYIRLSIEFGISYAKAYRILRALAEFFPDKYEYNRGTLMVKT